MTNELTDWEREHPVQALMNLMAVTPFEELRAAVASLPVVEDICVNCGERIVKTPWVSPEDVVRVAGWIHRASEASPCAHRRFQFAEPLIHREPECPT